jgi:hypothetical protein
MFNTNRFLNKIQISFFYINILSLNMLLVFLLFELYQNMAQPTVF